MLYGKVKNGQAANENKSGRFGACFEDDFLELKITLSMLEATLACR